jgi:hypothetical protein
MAVDRYDPLSSFAMLPVFCLPLGVREWVTGMSQGEGTANLHPIPYLRHTFASRSSSTDDVYSHVRLNPEESGHHVRENVLERTLS